MYQRKMKIMNKHHVSSVLAYICTYSPIPRQSWAVPFISEADFSRSVKEKLRLRL